MSTPLWRQMYNTWERAVAPGLEDLTASNGFRDVLAMGLRANAEVAREVDRLSRQWLHLWNLPAATDVRKLRKQVAGLERELMAMRLELERQGRADRPATTGRSTARSADSGSTAAAAGNGSTAKAAGNGSTAKAAGNGRTAA